MCIEIDMPLIDSGQRGQTKSPACGRSGPLSSTHYITPMTRLFISISVRQWAFPCVEQAACRTLFSIDVSPAGPCRARERSVTESRAPDGPCSGTPSALAIFILWKQRGAWCVLRLDFFCTENRCCPADGGRPRPRRVKRMRSVAACAWREVESRGPSWQKRSPARHCFSSPGGGLSLAVIIDAGLGERAVAACYNEPALGWESACENGGWQKLIERHTGPSWPLQDERLMGVAMGLPEAHGPRGFLDDSVVAIVPLPENPSPLRDIIVSCIIMSSCLT